jgi:hypothetical protein
MTCKSGKRFIPKILPGNISPQITNIQNSPFNATAIIATIVASFIVRILSNRENVKSINEIPLVLVPSYSKSISILATISVSFHIKK